MLGYERTMSDTLVQPLYSALIVLLCSKVYGVICRGRW